MAAKKKIKPDHYLKIYKAFEASITRLDCGSRCAPLNGGEPVCCSTQHAVPVMDNAEWHLLRSRTKMWSRFHAYDAATREIVDTLAESCTAAECNGARHCERENRSLACRSFPFFPYITREGDLIGLAYHWTFEDRCWVMSNLGVVEQEFVDEFVRAYEMLFKFDPGEYTVFKDHSAAMRRVYTRWNRFIPLIGRDGGYFKVLPRGGGVKRVEVTKFHAHGPYVSEEAYAEAVKEAEAEFAENADSPEKGGKHAPAAAFGAAQALEEAPEEAVEAAE